ncbi:hypothetical protein LDH16_07790, partial [Mycobacterium tuberculosis]
MSLVIVTPETVAAA